MSDHANQHVAKMAELTTVEMEQVQGGGETKSSSAVVFVGGWGSSMYQYAY